MNKKFVLYCTVSLNILIDRWQLGITLTFFTLTCLHLGTTEVLARRYQASRAEAGIHTRQAFTYTERDRERKWFVNNGKRDRRASEGETFSAFPVCLPTNWRCRWGTSKTATFGYSDPFSIIRLVKSHLCFWVGAGDNWRDSIEHQLPCDRRVQVVFLVT